MPGRAPLPRLALPAEPAVIYAIGDVHGCLDKLRALEARILVDARGVGGLKLLVLLGDYVDRGPDSVGVLTHLLAPPPEGFSRICLRGNHDDMLLRFLDGSVDPEWWLGFGGDETLRSYGLDPEGLGGNRRALSASVRRLRAAMPASHSRFLANLPVALSTPRYVFSHAGARPGVPLAAQSDEDLMWVRRAFLDHKGAPFEQTLVHGHTPASAPFASRYRIGLDTNAARGGKLSAARLAGADVRFLSV